MRFNHTLSSEFVAVIGLGAAVGLLLGIGISGAVFIARASDLSSKLQEKSAQITVLKAMLDESVDFTALDKSPDKETHAQAAVRTADVATTPSLALAPAPVQPAPRPRPRPAEQSPSVLPAEVVDRKSTAPAPVQPAPRPRPAEQSPSVLPAEVVDRKSTAPSARLEPPGPPSVPVPAAVNTNEIAAVMSGARIEGVSAQKARVSRLSAEGVHLSSGKLIRPGERFASGERLLQVDPENNRVVTSHRQLLLFFGN